MLVSPLRLHHNLTALLSPTEDSGPHTALLILPQGRLLASATLYDEICNDQPDDDEGRGPEVGNLALEDEVEGGDEPYLDESERLRLLCGLASQWEEDESPRVECELGRLLLVPVPLPPAETATTMAQNLPATKGLQPKMFVLVLNGTKGTAWNHLVAKAEDFKKSWASGPQA